MESSLGGTTGLYALEQRLRYLIGMAATDGRLLRPSTEPIDAKVVFDWNSSLGQSLDRRVEVRRQRLNVKRRDMELTAARLNLRPRLDFLAQYRWRGLGDNLFGDTTGQLDNLYGSILGGNFQEAQAGFEMNMPVGLRSASTAVAHAKLNLKRERALLSEVELRISHDLSDAARQVTLTFQLLQTNYNRYLADLHQVDVLRRRYRDGSDNINFLLQAQRQVVISESEFYRSLVNYNLAIRDFHRQKGSLLAYNHVHMAEGPWASGAAADARRNGKFVKPRHNPSATSTPAPVSRREFHPSEVQPTPGITEMVAAPAASESQDHGPVMDAPAEPTSPGDKAPGEDPDQDFPDHDFLDAGLEFQDVETLPLPAASTGMLESQRVWR